MGESSLVRLGRAVKARREDQGWSQMQVAGVGGPSHTTLARIENVELDRVAPKTLHKLDTGLKWVRGSAEEVLAGGNPTPLESMPSPAIAGPLSIPLPVEDVTALLAVSSRVDSALTAGADAATVETARKVMKDYVSRIVGRYATQVLEVNGGPAVPLPLMVEMAFREHLDRPVESEDPAEREEQDYRRWLAGRYEADPETAERFRRRWKRSRHQPE